MNLLIQVKKTRITKFKVSLNGVWEKIDFNEHGPAPTPRVTNKQKYAAVCFKGQRGSFGERIAMSVPIIKYMETQSNNGLRSPSNKETQGCLIKTTVLPFVPWSLIMIITWPTIYNLVTKSAAKLVYQYSGRGCLKV